MRRLLLVVCWLAAAQTVCARKPAVRFDLPYTLERGKYVVTVETAAGPRRFAFDTGASQTCISERLSRELGLAASGRGTVGRFRRPSSCDHLCPGAVSPDGRGDLLRPAGDRAARQLLYLPLSGLRRHCGQRSAARLRRADAQCRLDDHAGGRPAPARRVPLPGRCADSLCGKRSCNRRPCGQRASPG